jgi:hypothetical protein
MLTSSSRSPRGLRRPCLTAAAPLLLLMSAWSCTDAATRPGPPATRDLASSEPHFLRSRAGAPAYAALSASFYAKLDEAREVSIYYHPLDGAADSTQFLRFLVPAGALATSPEGRAYAAGDSVLINVAITDPARMVVAFEPSGLKFSPTIPATLELSFEQADGDLNQDGVVDGTDIALETQLSLWVRETANGAWAKLPSSLFLDRQKLEAAIPGFSGYAAAY